MVNHDDHFEDRLRSRLHDRVEGVRSTAPSPGGIIRRAQMRRHRRRAAAGVLAAVGVGASGALVWRDAPGGGDVAVLGAPGDPAGTTDPAVASQPLGERLVLDGWTTTMARIVAPWNPTTVGRASYVFEKDGRTVSVNLHRPGSGDRLVRIPEPRPVTVRGVPGQWTAPTTLLWQEGSWLVQLSGGFGTSDEAIAVAGALVTPGDATWRASLPAGTELDRAEAVDGLLQGVPLPPGLTASDLREGSPATRHTIAGDVYGRVFCGWTERWAAGDEAQRAEAVAALGSVRSWPGAGELTSPRTGESPRIDEFTAAAAALATGDVEAARRMPNLMGCPGADSL